MKPKPAPAQEPDGLFKTQLEHFINMSHPLVQLADRINWKTLDEAVATHFAETGRPGLPSRFMIGMLILKSVENLSDEVLWARWPRDPYYQYFTGERYFQHKLPHERSVLSHWRGRLGADFLDQLLAESLRVAHDAGALSGADMEAVSVDTTVQEKAVAYPTDAKLAYRALKHLAAQARDAGVKLRQSYIRVGKRAQIMVGRYAHAKQFKRRNKALKFLKTRLGRVMRDIERKIAGNEALKAAFADSLTKAGIIHKQVLNRKAKVKLYSWHAPEVECIGKGKAHKPYEFGVKASFTTTNARAKAGMFVLHAETLPGKPFDGHTLGKVLNETGALTGVTPKRVHVDKGYRGHKQNLSTFDPKTMQSTRPPWRVYISGRKALKPHIAKELKRRSAIEPVIGHMKSDHRLAKNHLKGTNGDRFNTKMAAIGYNFARIIAWFKDMLVWLLIQCVSQQHQTTKISAS